MPRDELVKEIADGIHFWIAETDGQPTGVMGIQDKGAVALVRHAYVSTGLQRRGVGAALLKHVQSLTAKPMLIGTWRDATWAIAFYERNGFMLLSDGAKEILLRRFWSIPARQIETSVVLADGRWMESAVRAER
jgi:GNAT superfamily N-acetyltransferase